MARTCLNLSSSNLAAIHANPNSLLASHAAASVAIGKYRIAALTRPQPDGRFSAGVSIRSGQGSASTDRVLRFAGCFDSEAAAHRYAHEQGAIWVAHAGRAVCLDH